MDKSNRHRNATGEKYFLIIPEKDYLMSFYAYTLEYRKSNLPEPAR